MLRRWSNLDSSISIYPRLLAGSLALVADLGKAVSKKKIQLLQ
jgi:hypothetical protein